uniref:Uncharacterized protein n=1 Tax=Arundo donax TaxID=35708 RepID=A0A0A8Y434_ARUDO
MQAYSKLPSNIFLTVDASFTNNQNHNSGGSQQTIPTN